MNLASALPPLSMEALVTVIQIWQLVSRYRLLDLNRIMKTKPRWESHDCSRRWIHNDQCDDFYILACQEQGALLKDSICLTLTVDNMTRCQRSKCAFCTNEAAISIDSNIPSARYLPRINQYPSKNCSIHDKDVWISILDDQRAHS